MAMTAPTIPTRTFMRTRHIRLHERFGKPASDATNDNYSTQPIPASSMTSHRNGQEGERARPLSVPGLLG